jgi:hypothetical protein
MSGLELVAKFYDVHVHAETGRSVQAGIGEVLEPKASIGVGKRIDTNPRGRDDLNRASEVLCAERVVAEESCPSADVEGDKPPPSRSTQDPARRSSSDRSHWPLSAVPRLRSFSCRDSTCSHRAARTRGA